MTDRAVADIRQGDYSDEELAAVAAALAGIDADRVCQVVVAMSVHDAAGGHELMALTTIPGDREATAALFRHAADHVHGGCTRCRRRNRREGNRE